MKYETLKKKISKFLIVGNAIPFIVIVPVFAYVFCYQLEWVRFKFQADSFKSYLFAIFLLSLKPTLQMTEMLIHRWQEIEREFFIVTAKSKGLTRNQVLWRHSFITLVPSFFSYANSILLLMLSGNFLLESFYSIPGIGLTFVESLGSRDLPIILACVILIGNFYFFFYGISNFLKNLFFIYHGHENGEENGQSI
ncbi:MAG: ABC transporter permease subunit [Bdellovibrionaceae bacterium]|nr:ABC transporter permease subunit [Pseudobdellovibrionaceae bacterium]